MEYHLLLLQARKFCLRIQFEKPPHIQVFCDHGYIFYQCCFTVPYSQNKLDAQCSCLTEEEPEEHKMIPGTIVETADMPRYDQQARYDQQERYDQQTRSAINPTNNPAQGAAPIYVDPTGYVVRASSSRKPNKSWDFSVTQFKKPPY